MRLFRYTLIRCYTLCFLVLLLCASGKVALIVGIRAEVPYRRSDTRFFGTIRSVPREEPRYDMRSEHRSKGPLKSVHYLIRREAPHSTQS